MKQNALDLSIDLNKYKAGVVGSECKYGLPATIEFCARCAVSNQRPNSVVEFHHTENSKKKTIHFDDNGVCDACRTAELKFQNIDWEEREHKLTKLCDRFRSQNGSCTGARAVVNEDGGVFATHFGV